MVTRRRFFDSAVPLGTTLFSGAFLLSPTGAAGQESDAGTSMRIALRILDAAGADIEPSSVRATPVLMPDGREYEKSTWFRGKDEKLPKVFAGPIKGFDETDEQKLWMLRLQIPGYWDLVVPPRTYPNGLTVLPDMKAIRDPKHWRPDFKAWSQLGHSFEGLKSKLKESGKVYALKGRSIELFSDFSNNAANAYDRPALDDSWRPKCALLNITRVLEGERIPARQGMWFSRVQRIRAVSGERVIAVVEAETFREVDELASSRQIDVFDCGSYAWAPGREHKRNFVNADGTRAKIKDWRSVKSPICRGNLQLTVARTEGGETLADIDMDENRTMLRHLADMYKHKWTGGTDPVQIGQVLKIHNPQLDLGYTFTQV